MTDFPQRFARPGFGGFEGSFDQQLLNVMPAFSPLWLSDEDLEITRNTAFVRMESGAATKFCTWLYKWIENQQAIRTDPIRLAAFKSRCGRMAKQGSMTAESICFPAGKASLEHWPEDDLVGGLLAATTLATSPVEMSCPARDFFELLTKAFAAACVARGIKVRKAKSDG